MDQQSSDGIDVGFFEFDPEAIFDDLDPGRA
jgi:hypothetical protein